MRRGLLFGLICVLPTVTFLNVEAPLFADSPAVIVDPDAASAARTSAESVRQLVFRYKHGFDLTYVARTTLSRDLSAWRVAASKNDPAGQLMLGLCNYYGIGGAHNPTRGRELILAAANAGHAEALAVASIILRNGNLATRPDEDEANGLLGKAIVAKSQIAADEVAMAGARELLVAGDEEAAIKSYGTAMRAGSLNAQVAFANSMRRAWLGTEGLDRSLSILEEAARQGHVQAMTQIGSIYALGRYVKPDAARAKRWIAAAADTGDPRALAAAAMLYDRGCLDAKYLIDFRASQQALAKLKANGDPYSVFQVYLRALADRATPTPSSQATLKSLLADAATRGCPAAYGYYGYLFHSGELATKVDPEMCHRLFDDGVVAGEPEAYFQRACGERFGYWGAADEDKARDDFFAAARLGVPEAMTSVGLRYISGRGVKADRELGHLYYLAAAFEGDAMAMSAVASQYETGMGVARNVESSRRWCEIALAEGQVDAYATLAILEGETGAVGKVLPPKSLAFLELGVKQGSLACARNLGNRLARGVGLKQDVQRGLALLGECATRDALGISHCLLGDLYFYGDVIPKDIPSALLYYRTAADRGNGDAFANLSYMYEVGEGTKVDSKEALSLLERGVTLGSESSMFQLGCHAAGGLLVPHDDARAIALWKQAADGNYSPAFFSLGQANLLGMQGLPVNEVEGVKWFDLAVKNGDPKAAAAVAQYYRGRKDFEKERVWNERGDALGDAGAANNLGVMYRFGRGVPQDFTKAAECYKRGADRGDLDALSNYAWCIETGNGVPMDKGEAFRTQLKAATAGSTNAMFLVGRMYFDGIGIARDSQAASYWLQKAADGGHELAKGMVGVMKAKGLIQ